MSQLSDLAAEGLAMSIEIAGDSFSWNGRNFSGLIDHINHTVTAAKSDFAGVYPKCGDAIRIYPPGSVNGKKYQIVRKNHARLQVVRGGFVEDPPFVDDPGDPALELQFDHFVKK
jgi:hypothetical protein